MGSIKGCLICREASGDKASLFVKSPGEFMDEICEEGKEDFDITLSVCDKCKDKYFKRD